MIKKVYKHDKFSKKPWAHSFIKILIFIIFFLFIVILYPSKNEPLDHISNQYTLEGNKPKTDASKIDEPKVDIPRLDESKINQPKPGTQKNNIPKSDTPKFVSTYLTQQGSNVKPDGSDGVKVVYLTFDDGPSTSITPRILDILKEKNVHATFFVIGKLVDSSDEEKELIKRTINEGNSIGIHTYYHNYQLLYPNRSANVNQIMKEIEMTKTSLKKVLGDDFDTSAVRLPGGHMSWNNMYKTDEQFKALGYYSIDWNELIGDAERVYRDSDNMVNYLRAQHQYEKAVVLMHDAYNKEETVKALPRIIDFFKENGYEFRTIKDTSYN